MGKWVYSIRVTVADNPTTMAVDSVSAQTRATGTPREESDNEAVLKIRSNLSALRDFAKNLLTQCEQDRGREVGISRTDESELRVAAVKFMTENFDDELPRCGICQAHFLLGPPERVTLPSNHEHEKNNQNLKKTDTFHEKTIKT